MPEIKIDRLEIRMKGISPATARDSLSGLTVDLARQLKSRRRELNREKPQRIERIDLGSLEHSRGDAAPAQLRGRIAGAIAAAVVSNCKNE